MVSFRWRILISALSIEKKELELARDTINRIDDYFEYSYVSKDDQEVVQKILDEHTKKLTELYS